ncbi:hypothetical protein [Mycobacteroides abscessus]|uniref:hypothetical protein n=1 Tax=Mycobacteroides abscessus TaxID=36809 RepID=UPI0009C7CD76|nr:hypothetical protein [Mycobacteroides abscessus]SLH42194.1 Uncharacterised protein [Mycobacteroides abscessus subsp. abscessus]
MTEPTFSLPESSQQIVGSDSPQAQNWLRKRLCTGQLPGYKARRQWRMSESDIAAAIKILRPTPTAVPEIPGPAGMTRTSRRRLAS